MKTRVPSYQTLKALFKAVPDLKLDRDHMMIVSPDEGGMSRNVYFASVLGLDVGMFYKRRDYTRIINGRNPIIAHEYIGADVEGKDIFIADDIISSGESIIDLARELKRRKARRIFVSVTYAFFTDGLETYKRAYQDGIIDLIFSTNLTYRSPELLAQPWYVDVDMAKYSCAHHRHAEPRPFAFHAAQPARPHPSPDGPLRLQAPAGRLKLRLNLCSQPKKSVPHALRTNSAGRGIYSSSFSASAFSPSAAAGASSRR